MTETAPNVPFQSKLTEGWKRFLAHVIEHGFEVGRRDPVDFIRHFPPAVIMEGLRHKPVLRANILVICTGTRMKIALKKSAESCAEDLQIALDEDEADAETIVTLFAADDRVRHLDAQMLWTYVTEGDFWEAKDDPVAAEHLAYVLERALQDGLVSHREVVEAISTEKLAELLPREQLHELLAGALNASHDSKPFSEAELLATVPPRELVKSIPLPELWAKIVVPHVAVRHKLEEAPVPVPDLGTDDGDDDDLDMDIDDVLEMDEKANGKAATA